jgi:hypothetical protein
VCLREIMAPLQQRQHARRRSMTWSAQLQVSSSSSCSPAVAAVDPLQEDMWYRFDGEVKIKAISIIGGPNRTSPDTVKLYASPDHA